MDASRDLSRSFSLTNKKLTLISNHSNSGENFPSSSSFDITARIILIGDSGVGKSSIILRYIQDSFKEKSPCTAGLLII